MVQQYNNMKQYSFSIKNKKEQTKSSIYDVSFYDYERELKQNSEKLLQSSRSISSILILVAINSPIISIFSTSLPISTDISKKTSFFLDDFVSVFGWVVHSFICQFDCWLVHKLDRWFVHRLYRWLVRRLYHWLVRRLYRWLVHWLYRWLVPQLYRSSQIKSSRKKLDGPTDRPTDRLTLL